MDLKRALTIIHQHRTFHVVDGQISLTAHRVYIPTEVIEAVARVAEAVADDEIGDLDAVARRA